MFILKRLPLIRSNDDRAVYLPHYYGRNQSFEAVLRKPSKSGV